MNKQTKIAFLGGDGRQHTAAVKLIGGVWDIYEWGQDIAQEQEGIFLCDNIYEAISDATAVILPLPSSVDGITLNTPSVYVQNKIELASLADAVPSNCIIIGGKLVPSFCQKVMTRGIKCFDYFDSEDFQIKNAYTTAEAALSIAMDKLSKNIRDSKFAITGYGRIAKQLSKLLTAFGADVTVCARKSSDLTWAQLEGCNTQRLEEGVLPENLLCGYDVIFNTVPRRIFGEEFLERVDRKTLMIELASSPGGIDVSSARRLRSNVLWAASLPGKYAPESAGALIAECVIALLEGEVRGV